MEEDPVIHSKHWAKLLELGWRNRRDHMSKISQDNDGKNNRDRYPELVWVHGLWIDSWGTWMGLNYLNVGSSYVAWSVCWGHGSGTRIYPRCINWLFEFMRFLSFCIHGVLQKLFVFYQINWIHNINFIFKTFYIKGASLINI